MEDYSRLASQYYQQGDFARALVYLQKISVLQPRNTSVLTGMANCYFELGDDDNGIRILEYILSLDGANAELCFHLSQIHARRGDIERTVATCERALEIDPGQLDYYLHLADICEKSNRHSRGLEVIARGLERFPDADALQILAARTHRRLGDIEACLECLDGPDSREDRLSEHWQTQYHFELGFALDRNNDADGAFRHFTRANELIRARPRYREVDAEHPLKLIRSLTELDFDRVNDVIRVSRKHPPPRQPVFFVGFPRSGTTLLQKALDSHPDITVIEEDNPLGRVTSLIEQQSDKYLQSPFLLEHSKIEELREIYYREARRFVDIDKTEVLVDKLPMNIVQIHVIKMLFPDAKILLGLRHPCDSILSCFMQNFGINRAMAQMFEFSSTIDYYDKTMNLWQLFRRRIEFDCLGVRYEDIVEDMEGEARRLLQFLGLPWNDEVLNYRNHALSRGLINTPSYGQVVKPIYRESRYRWRRYARYFEPWYEVLEPHCQAFGYSLEDDGTAQAAG